MPARTSSFSNVSSSAPSTNLRQLTTRADASTITIITSGTVNQPHCEKKTDSKPETKKEKEGKTSKLKKQASLKNVSSLGRPSSISRRSLSRHKAEDKFEMLLTTSLGNNTQRALLNRTWSCDKDGPRVRIHTKNSPGWPFRNMLMLSPKCRSAVWHSCAVKACSCTWDNVRIYLQGGASFR